MILGEIMTRQNVINWSKQFVMPSAKTFLLTDMNRSDLQENLIQQILDDMDLDGLMQLAYDYMDESYGKYSDEELKEEVKEYYPHILEESDTNWLAAATSCLSVTQNEHGVQNRVL